MVIKKQDAFRTNKQGVDIWIYSGKEQCSEAAIVYQETIEGHFEEFYHGKSTFLFYIIEGNGKWFIDKKEFEVETGDVVIVPKNTKFYYTGRLKQICVTAPAWEEEHEHHVRMICK